MFSLRSIWRYSRALFLGMMDGWGTPLLNAAFNGEIKKVRALLDAGADIEEGEKSTPLALAILGSMNSVRRIEVVWLLLDRGAKTEGPGVQSALTFAEKLGHTQIVDLLAEAGAESARTIVSRRRR